MGQGGAVGPYSDVYGFGRTCYFALLGTPEPDDMEKESLPETVAEIPEPLYGQKIGPTDCRTLRPSWRSLTP